MAQVLRVEQSVISGISARLVAAGERSDSARATLVSGIDGLGQCWGDNDEFSRTFAKEYVPGRDNVLDASKDLGQFLVQLGQRLKAVGASFEATDNA